MSDNPDVVPPESIVNAPADYVPEAATDEELPVSLDDLPEAVEPEAEDAPEAEPEGEPEAEPEPEKLIFDFGGNKLEVDKASLPEEVAASVDRFSKDIWADYTRKSQANADQAKSLKARAEALDNIQTLNDQVLDAFSRGKSIKAEIEQLSAVDLNALWQSNPDQARRISDQRTAKQAELDKIINAVDQHEHQLANARQAELERQKQEGRDVLDRKYKGFSSDIAPDLQAYAVSQGVPEADAKNWDANPVVAEMAYKAMMYDRMQNAAKPKPEPKKAAPVKAMPNKGANRDSANPNSMSFSELGRVLGLK